MRAYYRTFLDSPHAVAIKTDVGGQAVGFLVGATRARAHRRWTLRHRGATLALLAAAGLVGHPRVAVRFVRTRLARYLRTWRRHRVNESAQRSVVAPDPAVLTHVAVVPGARGSGAGQQLVEAFTDHARRAGADRALLTTLAGEGGAGGFYERLGWRKSGVHTTADGHRVEEWTFALEVAIP
nr:GNAT family N-acetyltransferase [Thermoleophilum album]